MSNEQQQHRTHMLVMFGKLFKGELSGIKSEEVPTIAEFGYALDKDLNQIAVDLRKKNDVSMEEIEKSLGDFNRKYVQLLLTFREARQDTGDLTLQEEIGSKELGDLKQLMIAINSTLGMIKENANGRGEDFQEWDEASTFFGIPGQKLGNHQMLSKIVNGSISNLEEAKRCHFPKQMVISEYGISPDSKQNSGSSILPESKHDRPSSTRFSGRAKVPNRGVASAGKFGILYEGDVPASRDR